MDVATTRLNWDQPWEVVRHQCRPEVRSLSLRVTYYCEVGVAQSSELVRAVKACDTARIKAWIQELRLPDGVRLSFKMARRRLPLLNFAFTDCNISDKEVQACVQLLVDHRAEINLKFEVVNDRSGQGSGLRTVLKEAVLRDSPTLLKWLFENRADFNIEQCGRHILSVALAHNCYRAAAWMLCTDKVLDGETLRDCFAADATLKEFAKTAPPQCGVLQNILVERVSSHADTWRARCCALV